MFCVLSICFSIELKNHLAPYPRDSGDRPCTHHHIILNLSTLRIVSTAVEATFHLCRHSRLRTDFVVLKMFAPCPLTQRRTGCCKSLRRKVGSCMPSTQAALWQIAISRCKTWTNQNRIVGESHEKSGNSVTKRYEKLEGHAILWRFTNHTEEKSPCWLINDDFLDSEPPIIEMSEEKKTYRKKDHRYLCSYRAPRLDTIRKNKRKQLLFHDLSTWSATDSIWFSAIAAHILAFQNPSIGLLFDKTGWFSNSESKAPSANEGGIQIEKKKQGDTRGTIFSTFLVFKPTSQRG